MAALLAPKAPIDFEKLQERQTEPTTGKCIAWLIDSDSDYIVFLDDEDFVWWTWNGEYGNKIPDYAEVVGRIAVLEAIDTKHLSEEQRHAYKRLIGEGMAALLGSRKREAAKLSLDEAGRYIKARNQELARCWNVTASSFFVIVPVLVSVLTWLNRTSIKDCLGERLFELLLVTGAGALGAFLSIILRTGNLLLDISAGRKMYVVEGGCRVLAGVIGAWFLTLCFQGELLLGAVAKMPQRIVVIVALAMLAGVSERLVPDLIKRLESSADNPKTNSSKS